MHLSRFFLLLASFILVINGCSSLKIALESTPENTATENTATENTAHENTIAEDTVPEPSQNVEKVVFYFLYSTGCPHCINAKPFVESLSKKYPQVEFRLLEVTGSEENKYIYYAKIKKLGITSTGVPLFVIGKNYKLGFDESKKSEIEDMIKKALQTEPKEKNL